MKRVLWAIDPMKQDPKLLKKTASLIESWTKGTESVVEPVCILTPALVNLLPKYFSEYRGDIEEAVTQQMNHALRRIKLSGLSQPTFLVSDAFSVRSSIKALIDHSVKSGADVLVVGTHGRKGAPRFFLGSFAETLILHSKVPVLVVGPHTKEFKKLRKILFPTDLSDASRRALLSVIGLAKATESKILLLHRIDYILDYGMAVYGGTNAYARYLDDQTEAQKRKFEDWTQEIKRSGVAVEPIWVDKPVSVASTVLSNAKRTACDLIALASEAGAFESALLGNVPRQVLRAAVNPVWVVHPSGRIA